MANNGNCSHDDTFSCPTKAGKIAPERGEIGRRKREKFQGDSKLLEKYGK